jgi:hypothetical protein
MGEWGRGGLLPRAGAMLVGLAWMVSASPLSAACSGDCDRDGRVSVAELVAGVTIGLNGSADVACPDYRCDPSECVMIQTLVGAVEHALLGCPGAPATPAPARVAETTAAPGNAPDDVVRALEAVQGATCRVVGPISQVSQWPTERGYSMYCLAGPGHDTRTALVRYPNVDAATAQWAAEAAPGEPFEIDGVPAAFWSVPFDIRPLEGAHQFVVWQLGCWVITVHTFDDTRFRIAPSPRRTAEAILELASDALLAQCPE